MPDGVKCSPVHDHFHVHAAALGTDLQKTTVYAV